MINNIDGDVDDLVNAFIKQNIIQTREEFFRIIKTFIDAGWLIKTGEVGPYSSFRLSPDAVHFVNGGPLGEKLASKLKTNGWLNSTPVT